MPTTIEERVAYLEGKVEKHSFAWQDIREDIRETNQRITHLEQKFDQRFIQMDQRFIGIEGRIDGIEKRLNETNQRIDRLFFFVLATLVTSIGSLIGVIVSIVIR